ncbi:metallophosphoesterase [Candidatus Woesearchaeota archaeon]|nr:metallophosphoesterase [Candidatus Woesearchaeota archaeon]
MKILATGDFHGDASLAQRLAQKAEKENVDLVIITGDITHMDKSFDGCIGPFKKAKKKVLFVPGNHDSFATADFITEFYGVKNIHGYSVKYEDVGIFGCGFANVGLNQLKEDEFQKILKDAFQGVKETPKKIMVTHVHPSGTKMEKFSHFVPGSSGVRKAVEELKPDILFCSHVHEAQGIEEKIGKTKVINVGREGTIIDI